MDKKDSLYSDAIKLIQDTGTATIPQFQRYLKIGYFKARELMSLLEKNRVVGEANGSKPRKINI